MNKKIVSSAILFGLITFLPLTASKKDLSLPAKTSTKPSQPNFLSNFIWENQREKTNRKINKPPEGGTTIKKINAAIEEKKELEKKGEDKDLWENYINANKDLFPYKGALCFKDTHRVTKRSFFAALGLSGIFGYLCTKIKPGLWKNIGFSVASLPLFSWTAIKITNIIKQKRLEPAKKHKYDSFDDYKKRIKKRNSK